MSKGAPSCLGPSRIPSKFDSELKLVRTGNDWTILVREPGVPSFLLEFSNGPVLVAALVRKPIQSPRVVSDYVLLHDRYASRAVKSAESIGKSVVKIEAPFPTARGCPDAVSAFEVVTHRSCLLYTSDAADE